MPTWRADALRGVLTAALGFAGGAVAFSILGGGTEAPSPDAAVEDIQIVHSIEQWRLGGAAGDAGVGHPLELGVASAAPEELETMADDPQALVDSLTEAFESERVDPTWSSVARQSFLQDLAERPAEQGAVIDVDCRTNMCMATMRWPSYQQALGSMERLAVGRYSYECARTVSLPPPHPGGTYEAPVFFDCSVQREAGQDGPS